jgi:hypothetical protein
MEGLLKCHSLQGIRLEQHVQVHEWVWHFMMMFVASFECSTILWTHLEEEAFHDMTLHLGDDVNELEWTG